jgi:hypothetical protein
MTKEQQHLVSFSAPVANTTADCMTDQERFAEAPALPNQITSLAQAVDLWLGNRAEVGVGVSIKWSCVRAFAPGAVYADRD